MVEPGPKTTNQQIVPLDQTQTRNYHYQSIPNLSQNLIHSSFIQSLKEQDCVKSDLKLRYSSLSLFIPLIYFTYNFLNAQLQNLPLQFIYYQCSLLSISLFFSGSVFVKILLRGRLKKKTRKIVCIQYSLAYCSLILTNLPVVETILDQTYDGPSLSVVPGLLVLVSLNQQTTLRVSHYYSIWNIFLAVCFGISTFVTSNEILHAMAESLIVLGFTLYYFRKNEWQSLKLGSLDKSEEDLEFKNDIEDVIGSIKSSLNELKQVVPFVQVNQYSGVVQIHRNLQRVLFILTSKPNIYQPNIENITRNMDENDKIFIQETFNCRNLFQRSDSKLNIRNTVELIPSIRYDIQELQGILGQIGKIWNFDMFFFSEFSGQKPLYISGKYLFLKFRLEQITKASQTTISNFMGQLQQKYYKNPYHNSLHASDVMSSFLFIVNNSDLLNAIHSMQLIACLLANLGHDVGHPGLTNRYLINTNDPVAIKYNDISVLQSMHSSIIFKILLQEKNNILAHLDQSQYWTIRNLVINLVLATDMGKHFQLLGQYKVKKLNQPLEGLENDQYRLDTLKMTIKAADVSHAAKNRDLHQMWSFRVIEEFFNQGDLEKEKGLKISMFCDRETTDISKSQAGFIKNIVLPLYQSLNQSLGSVQIEEQCIVQLEKNMAGWEEFGEELNTRSKHTSEFTNFTGTYEELSRKVSKKRGGTVISSPTIYNIVNA